jgi:hypothetical protein
MDDLNKVIREVSFRFPSGSQVKWPTSCPIDDLSRPLVFPFENEKSGQEFTATLELDPLMEEDWPDAVRLFKLTFV